MPRLLESRAEPARLRLTQVGRLVSASCFASASQPPSRGPAALNRQQPNRGQLTVSYRAILQIMPWLISSKSKQSLRCPSRRDSRWERMAIAS